MKSQNFAIFDFFFVLFNGKKWCKMKMKWGVSFKSLGWCKMSNQISKNIFWCKIKLAIKNDLKRFLIKGIFKLKAFQGEILRKNNLVFMQFKNLWWRKVIRAKIVFEKLGKFSKSFPSWSDWWLLRNSLLKYKFS